MPEDEIMEGRQIRNDLRCENCTKHEATTLLYYEQYHKESGRISLINPAFICDTCIPLFKGYNAFFENKPVLVGFEKIAQWDDRLMGLTSRKRYEFTCFANPYFRKKLHRIRYIWKKNERHKNQE